MEVKTRLHELLNGQKSNNIPLVNYIEGLDKKYGSYLN